MTEKIRIGEEAQWFRYEAKVLHIPTEGDVTTTTLRWVLLDRAGGSVKLDKVSSGMAPPVVGGKSGAEVTPDPSTDYASLPAGTYHYELWDTDNSLLLTYGDIVLGEAAAPA